MGKRSALFRPPSWSVEPSFFTLEGDPVVHGSATWRVHDPSAARERLRALGGLRPGGPIEIDITVPREVLVRDRPKPPPRAIVFEAGPIDGPDSVPVATVRLEGTRLHVETMSEERLDRGMQLVDSTSGISLSCPSGRSSRSSSGWTSIDRSRGAQKPSPTA
ncbi:MAG: hypothetical protein ACRDL4_12575 [Thermoleophilaceae bacterium]